MSFASLAVDWRRAFTPVIALTPAFTALGVAGALIVGWVASDEEPLTPKTGLGYWLGIAGASLMAVSLVYYVRKRVRKNPRAAHALPIWFRLHVVAGVAGPLLILFHCNFRLGAFNSNVALLSMGAVVASGVIGRYLYRFAYRAQTTALERVLAAWRYLHAPLCVVLVVSAVAHIWAVHRF